ncbi:TRAP transporter permease, partial [Chloroflexota bacterium]
ILGASGILLTVQQIFGLMAFTGSVMPQEAFLAVLLAIFLGAAFLVYPASKSSPVDKVPWYDAVFAVLGFLAPFSIAPKALYILNFGLAWDPPPVYLAAGIITWGLVLEATRRATTPVFTVILTFFSLYPLFAHLMPGWMIGMQYNWQQLVGYHFLGGESLFGIPINVVSRLIIGFIIFAIVLQATGGGTFFLNLALSIVGRVRGGVAKVSVFSSALFASISGSVVANVLTTGSVTIPIMKRAGYPPHYAAAIEACASTGGTLTPPVMGATAFIMAEFLGIPYITVAIAAAIPMLLYYLGEFIQVDAYAAKTGIKGLSKEEVPSFWQTMKTGWPYVIGFLVLLYFLAYARQENYAAWYATVALILVTIGRKGTRLTPRRLMETLEQSTKLLTEIAVMCASVGLIIGSLLLTGLAFSLADEMVALAGGSVFLILLLGAAASFIMGMGMTITACYILLALVIAPGLVAGGLHPLAVHMFVIYWGMISFITPPVCIGAYIAAGLAQADPMKTGWQATRLGIVLYFIPFFFVFEPALLLQGSILVTLRAVAACALGILLIGGGLEGYVLGLGKVRWLTRSLFVISGALIAYPELVTTFIGLGMGAAIALPLWVSKHFQPKKAPIMKPMDKPETYDG